jgi:hypothetical protein
MENTDSIKLVGLDKTVTKAISIAEIVKRNFNNPVQESQSKRELLQTTTIKSALEEYFSSRQLIISISKIVPLIEIIFSVT